MDRLITHTVHTDDGETELYWGRAQDDMVLTYEGSFLFHKDGSVTWKCWSNYGEPVVALIKGNKIIVANTEDQPPSRETFVFNSDQIRGDL